MPVTTMQQSVIFGAQVSRPILALLWQSSIVKSAVAADARHVNHSLLDTSSRVLRRSAMSEDHGVP